MKAHITVYNITLNDVYLVLSNRFGITARDEIYDGHGGWSVNLGGALERLQEATAYLRATHDCVVESLELIPDSELPKSYLLQIWSDVENPGLRRDLRQQIMKRTNQNPLVQAVFETDSPESILFLVVHLPTEAHMEELKASLKKVYGVTDVTVHALLATHQL